MLVLSRRVEQSIVFILNEPLPAGSVITITNVGRRGPETRFGIEAPKSVRIVRDEHLPPK